MSTTLSPGFVAAVAGFLAFTVIALPIIQAIIQKPWWPEHWKRGIQTGLAVVTGVVGYFAIAGFEVRTVSELVLWILAATAGSTTGYKGPLGGIAKAVETATTKAPYNDAEVTSHIDLEGDDAEDDLGEDPPKGFDDGSGPKPEHAATEHKP